MGEAPITAGLPAWPRRLEAFNRACVACSRLRFVDNRIGEQTHAGDLDLDAVAGFHPEGRLALGADAAGRAGEDDIAGRVKPDR